MIDPDPRRRANCPRLGAERLESHRRRTVLVWVGVGLALAAVAGVSIAAVRDDGSDGPTTVDDNARTVIEHGSIAALDHRLDVTLAQRTPSQTVGRDGSRVAARPTHAGREGPPRGASGDACDR